MRLSRFFHAALFSCLWIAILISFPHFFTYRVGALLCMLFFSLAMLGGFGELGYLSRRPGLQRVLRKLDTAFPLLLLSGIASFSLAALNEKLYSNQAEAHSVFNGFVTLAGVFPQSDSSGYLSTILQFLHYGDFDGPAVYRPIAHLFAAVLYRLVGGDWIRFFQVSSMLMVFSIWYHGIVMKRLFGRTVALSSAGLLCLYFALFQGTFMTEMLGGSLGMVGLSLLMRGLIVRSLRSYVLGFCLFTVAMHMRPGMIFSLPVLALAGAFHFRGRFPNLGLSIAFCAFILTASYALPGLQYRLFRKPVLPVSSHSQQLYQVFMDSDAWFVFARDYPMVKPGKYYGSTREWMVEAEKDIMEKIGKDPLRLVRNYFSMMLRYAAMPDRVLVPWSNGISPLASIGLSLLFLSGFLLHSRDSGARLCHWVILAYLLCSFACSPVLNEIKLRLYAASISLNTLFAAFAAINGLVILRRCLPSRSARSFSDDIGLLPLDGGAVAVGKSTGSRWIHGYPALLLLGALLGPLVVDRLREPSLVPEGFSVDEKDVPGTAIAVVSIRDSPFVLFDLERDFSVMDPRVVSRAKWGLDYPGDTTLIGKFYLLQTSDRVSAARGITGPYVLFIPERLLKGVPLGEIETMVVRQDAYAAFRYNMVFRRAHEVIAIGRSTGRSTMKKEERQSRRSDSTKYQEPKVQP